MQDLGSRVAEAVVLVRALPQPEGRPGEAVAILALNPYHQWLKLSPVSFRAPEDEQRFGRWDRLRFRLSPLPPSADAPAEACRADPRSIEITGQLRAPERAGFLSRAVVHSLEQARQAGRRLALLKPEVLAFEAERLSAADLLRKGAELEQLRARLDLVGQTHLMPSGPCPYAFRYRLRDADGERTIACQDWEMEAAFLKWLRLHGEKTALEEMARCYGEDLPRNGMALVTGAQEPDGWRAHGVIPLDAVAQPTLF